MNPVQLTETYHVRFEISIFRTNLQVVWLKKVLSSNSLVLIRNLVISSAEQLMAIADIIRSTHVPNYKAAMISFESSLNVEASEAHLQGYLDK